MPITLSELKARYRTKGDIGAFAHDGDRVASAHPMTPVEELFWTNEGPLIHKWHHYLPIYDRYLAPFRGSKVRMLEIGVSRGGSMELWRKYLGPDAVIFGIDIDPDCAKFNGKAAQVRIGSQADAKFLRDVVAEMGGVDIVLDDGSHVSQHMRASFDALYPLLSDGGLFLIEDMHACYWQDYGGGYRRPGSFIETVKTMIDDMHHWYHDQGQRIVASAGNIASLHVYDSMVVLEKRPVPPPRHSRRGHE